MIKCRIENCSNEAGIEGTARGLCRAHYHRWQRYGDENAPLRKISSWKGGICTENDCEKPIYAHGLCINHHAVAERKRRKDYDPENVKRRKMRFQAKRLLGLEQQMGRPRPSNCELCGNSPEGRGNKREAGICFDHDHKTGKPRGWLCDRCNKVLGLVYDDILLLQKLISYLEKSNGSYQYRTP